MEDSAIIKPWRERFLIYINPFVSNAPFLYPLKTSENLTVFWCFQGVEKGCIGNEWVNFLLTFEAEVTQNKSLNLKFILLIVIYVVVIETKVSSPNFNFNINQFKWINQLLLPLKSSENLWFSDDFRGNRN